MANNCQIPTPEEYVKEILNYAGYIHDLYGKKVLENSCGSGNILKEVVRRYITDAYEAGYNAEQIIIGLQKDIEGYDIDLECVEMCKENLDAIALEYGLDGISWNIKVQDYLKCKPKMYQYIIGNPPYITYHDLTVEQRNFLKKKYKSCEEGRFDYCYAFIEAGLRDLANDGKLAYIIPYSVIRNKFAEQIRETIKKSLEKIVDCKGIQLFPNVVSSSVIIVCDKRNRTNIFYHNKKENYDKVISKDNLQKKWIFDEKKRGNRRFGDFFKVSNSVATLYNKAFIFEATQFDDKFYYIGESKVEKNLVFDAASTKSEKKFIKDKDKRDKIIFPYRINNGRVVHMEEKELKKQFPECYLYLKKHKEKLLKRKSSENVRWYEYGRTQAINDVDGKKLVLSMVVTKHVCVYEANENAIPYAGAYIKVRPNANMTLKEAKDILESNEFYEYIKNYGTPTTPTSYRISVKDIEEYCF